MTTGQDYPVCAGLLLNCPLVTHGSAFLQIHVMPLQQRQLPILSVSNFKAILVSVGFEFNFKAILVSVGFGVQL